VSVSRTISQTISSPLVVTMTAAEACDHAHTTHAAAIAASRIVRKRNLPWSWAKPNIVPFQISARGCRGAIGWTAVFAEIRRKMGLQMAMNGEELTTKETGASEVA